MTKADKITIGVKIKRAVLDSVLSYSTSRSLLESMMKLDFKIGDRHTALMQLCFSYLAAWPGFLLIGLFWFKPFEALPLLSNWLGPDHLFVLSLLSGQLSSMLTAFVVIFVIQWVLRKEYLLIFLLFYLQSRGEIHIHLSVTVLLALYFSRTCYLWWLSVDSVDQTKKIWKSVSILQMLVWLAVAGVTLFLLDHIQRNFLWGESVLWSGRYGFLVVVLLCYHALNHLGLSLWGHFYFRRPAEPSDLPIYYSTANWILRFNMSHHLQNLLRNRLSEQMSLHQEHQRKLSDLPPHLRQGRLQEVVSGELGYLREANLRLTKI